MLFVIIGTISYLVIDACIKVDEVEQERAWKVSEETDWNEYQNNRLKVRDYINDF